jgi:hypothetical protein
VTTGNLKLKHESWRAPSRLETPTQDGRTVPLVLPNWNPGAAVVNLLESAHLSAGDSLCDRVYVKLDGSLDYSFWIKGLRARKSFVTNGPMLKLTNIGSRIGGMGPVDVSIKAKVAAQFPLEKFELIKNGKVIASGKFDEKTGLKPCRVGSF